jgi:hypothetical protein
VHFEEAPVASHSKLREDDGAGVLKLYEDRDEQQDRAEGQNQQRARDDIKGPLAGLVGRDPQPPPDPP